MELDQVLQALRNADAAGDAESAKRLAQIAQQLAGSKPQEAPTPPKESSILGEAGRSIGQFLSQTRTGLESAFNPNEAALTGIKRGEALDQAVGQGPSLEAVKQAYEQNGLLSAAGTALGQIPRALAGQTGPIGAAIAGGRTGAMLGTPLGPAGELVGGIAGAGLAMLPQFMGSNVERQAQEQQAANQPVDINRGKAFASAVGQAALEGIEYPTGVWQNHGQERARYHRRCGA